MITVSLLRVSYSTIGNLVVACLHTFLPSVVHQQMFKIVDMTNFAENSLSLCYKEVHMHKIVLSNCI